MVVRAENVQAILKLKLNYICNDTWSAKAPHHHQTPQESEVTVPCG